MDRALMPPAENPRGTCLREDIYYTWGLEVLLTLGNSDNIRRVGKKKVESDILSLLTDGSLILSSPCLYTSYPDIYQESYQTQHYSIFLGS